MARRKDGRRRWRDNWHAGKTVDRHAGKTVERKWENEKIEPENV
nr:MAG TPA: hypothetical protein [Caudoviricetes sp.]DAH66601.1 MAG TPA: hypothetical protein [Caudoviricetes sp.]DAJ66289.1 MAG TPA: hypothetical protein [Caudoviricetes sp.]